MANNDAISMGLQLTFRINYHTHWGESLCLVIDGASPQRFPLSTCDGKVWELPTPWHAEASGCLTYHYEVECEGRVTRQEMGRNLHTLHLSGLRGRLCITDAWRELPEHAPLFTSAFSGHDVAPEPSACLSVASQTKASRTLTLRVLCPCLRQQGRYLAIVGESAPLGAWQTACALPMTEIKAGHWQITLSTEVFAQHTAYKFVSVEAKTHQLAEWESGDNRHLYIPRLKADEHIALPEVELYFPLLLQRVVGTAVPLFALRTQGSQGIGDLGDLVAYIRWTKSAGMGAVQLLPINDTTQSRTWTDSYPYNVISVHALHPIYIDLRSLPALSDKAFLATYRQTARRLGAMAEVDYEAVLRLKEDYLRRVFAEHGVAVAQTADYQQFVAAERAWLLPYAAFCALRDRHHTADFSAWGQPRYVPEQIAAMRRRQPDFAREIDLYIYIQYALHIQMKAATQTARDLGIILKTDIPIGVSPHSVETWATPEYFHLDTQTGAPPDDFAAQGQNWGFPTYNWDTIARDGYAWWQQRLQHMAQYFDAYRIDHVLGFFRIWQIPSHAVHATLGHFAPALPYYAHDLQAMGFHFEPSRHTVPLITEAYVRRLCRHHAEYVLTHLLTPVGDGVAYRLSAFTTEQQARIWYEAHAHEVGHDDRLLDALYTMIDNVLFVEDTEKAGCYHPRIAAHETAQYAALPTSQQQAFDAIYHQYFYERHNEFWSQTAWERLTHIVYATPMLPCAEDLGMVPASVGPLLERLKVLTLCVQRMPTAAGEDFRRLWQYPYHAVCTTGTHDMATLRLWWEENRKRTTAYYREMLGHADTPPEALTPTLCREIVTRHMESPAMLCILPLQDYLAQYPALCHPHPEAERINRPDIPNYYWRYRMHIDIAALPKAQENRTEIK